MTVTELPTLIRRRERRTPEPEATPESQRLENLQAILANPALSGYHDDTRAAIAKLTATSTLAA